MDATEVETGERALEVMVIWGDNALLRVDHLSAPGPYYVEEGDSPVELLTADGALVIPDGAQGALTVGDVSTTLDCGAHPLPPFASARVSYRDFTYVVRSVNAGKAVGMHEGVRLDPRQQLWTALSFALHAVFVGAMYFMPPGASALSLETLADDPRLATYLMHPAEVQPPDWLPARDGGGKAEGERADGDHVEQPAPKQSRARSERPRAKPLTREQAIEQAQHAGILGALARSRPAWSGPTFDGELDYDPRDALTKLFGSELGAAEIFGGLAARGPGRNGSNGDGTIDVGRLGTVGRSHDGTRYGTVVGALRTREADVPRLRVGDAEVRGSLSKEAIRRAIQRRLNEVRFCYEQELPSHPNLQGRVQVKFVIAPDGAVQASQVESSTLAAPRAEACIAQAVRRWSFPAPDGGVVIVSYPFLFDSAP